MNNNNSNKNCFKDETMFNKKPVKKDSKITNSKNKKLFNVNEYIYTSSFKKAMIFGIVGTIGISMLSMTTHANDILFNHTKTSNNKINNINNKINSNTNKDNNNKTNKDNKDNKCEQYNAKHKKHKLDCTNGKVVSPPANDQDNAFNNAQQQLNQQPIVNISDDTTKEQKAKDIVIKEQIRARSDAEIIALVHANPDKYTPETTQKLLDANYQRYIDGFNKAGITIKPLNEISDNHLKQTINNDITKTNNGELLTAIKYTEVEDTYVPHQQTKPHTKTTANTNGTVTQNISYHDGKGHYYQTTTKTHNKQDSNVEARDKDLHHNDHLVVADNHNNKEPNNKDHHAVIDNNHKNHLCLTTQQFNENHYPTNNKCNNLVNNQHKYHTLVATHLTNYQRHTQDNTQHVNNLVKASQDRRAYNNGYRNNQNTQRSSSNTSRETFHEANVKKIGEQNAFHAANVQKIKDQQKVHQANVEKWNQAHQIHNN